MNDSTLPVAIENWHAQDDSAVRRSLGSIENLFEILFVNLGEINPDFHLAA
jgi:hypothetical protein